MARLGGKTTLSVSKDVYGNTFVGDVGTVVDQAPKGANVYLPNSP